MARWLRQNTQVCAAVGPFIKTADGGTAVIGADVVSGGCRVKKNNANWGPVKSDVFTNEDGGGPFYEIALSAGDVDTLGLLRWTVYPSAAFPLFQVWEDFMVVDPVTYDSYFGTGPMRADVNVWNHTSVASITTAGTIPVDVMYFNHTNSAGNAGIPQVNIVQWLSAAPAALGSAATVPADVLYWNHGSVTGIVTAGAPSINVILWNSSPVSAMPGAPGAIAGSVDVSSWGGKAVAAITTAGTIPVDVMYFNHTNSAGNAGVPQVNVVQWLSAAPAAIVTAGTIPVDIIYVNHTQSAGNAGLLAVNVEQWGSAALSTVLVSANVGSFTAGVQLPAVTSVVNIGSGAITATSYADAAIRQATLATTLLVSANVGSFAAGAQLPAVTSVVNIGSGAITATSHADAAIRQATLATTLLVSANVGSIGTGVLVSANVGQWRGTVPSALSGTLVQSHVATMSAGVVNYAAIGFDTYKKIIFWETGSAQTGSSRTSVSSNNIIPNTSDFFKGNVILFTSGTCQGVMRRITGQTGNVLNFAATPFEVSAGDDYGIIMTSWMEAPGGAAADVNVLTWLGATPNALVAGNVMGDVQMWAHSSVSAMPPGTVTIGSVNVNTWAGVSVAVPTTAAGGVGASIPVDVLYWNHGSVTGIVTAGAPSINVVTWAGSPVSAMPGGATVVGGVDVSSWAGKAVAAIVTAGWPRVEIASYAAGEAPPTSVSIAAGGIVAGSFASNAIDANALAASAVDEILDDALESTITVRQALRIMLAACAGKLSGANTTNILIRDFLDTKNRIDATVTVDGNRTNVTLDGT